jgi:hypothetical protein
MKTFSYVRQYLSELFLEWEMFQINVVQKIKIHILCPIPFFRTSCRLLYKVEIYGAAREAANDSCRVLHVGLARLHARKHTPAPVHPHHPPPAPPHTHARAHDYVILIAFPGQQLFRDRPSMLRHTYIVCLILRLCRIRYQSHPLPQYVLHSMAAKSQIINDALLPTSALRSKPLGLFLTVHLLG